MNRAFWIDLIRVVAPFCVVMRHVSGRVADGYNTNGETAAWLACQVYRQTSSCAVLLFIMISGALLLGRNETMSVFYRKRFGKILLPFFAWSFIYIFCRWLVGQTLEGGTPITLTSSIGAILSMNVSGHFWFMYGIISLYLVAPFLSVFVRNASKSMLTSFLVLWFFAVIIFPVINEVAAETLDITRIAFRFEFVSYWVGLFIAGYVLKDVLISKRWAVAAIVLWFCLSIAVPVNTYLLNVYSDSSMVLFLLVFMGKYILPIVSHDITTALIVFLIIRSLGDLPVLSSSWFGRMVPVFVPLSFGIYLCHMLFVIPTMKILALGRADTSWIIVLCAIPVVTAVLYFASAGLVYLLRWSRFLKFLAP